MLLFVAALAIMMVYSVLVLGKVVPRGQHCCVQGRKAVAGVGILTVLLAIGVSMGLGALFGVPETALTNIMAFLALGIGVDDMFARLMQHWHARTKNSHAAQPRTTGF